MNANHASPTSRERSPRAADPHRAPSPDAAVAASVLSRDGTCCAHCADARERNGTERRGSVERITQPRAPSKWLLAQYGTVRSLRHAPMPRSPWILSPCRRSLRTISEFKRAGRVSELATPSPQSSAPLELPTSGGHDHHISFASRQPRTLRGFGNRGRCVIAHAVRTLRSIPSC